MTATSGAALSRELKILLVLLFLMNLLNYLDRNALSVVAPVMRRDLGLSTVEYAYAVNAFLLAYAVMYAGSGMLVDRFGYRFSLALFVGAWSLVCGLHAAINGLFALVILRFFLGVAEPGGFTGAVKTLAARFSARQRGLATGIFTSGSGIGALLAPPLMVFLSARFGWRNAFLVPALAGLLWVPLWLSSTAGGDAAPAPAARQRVSFSWFANRRVLAYVLVRFFGDSSGYFFSFWMPEYLVSAKRFSFTMVGTLGWIPPCFSDLGAILGGYLSGRLVRLGYEPVLCRKLMMSASALLVLAGTLLQTSSAAWQVLVALALCTFGVGMWAANLHALPGDAFDRQMVATVHGLAGSAGAVGGVLFNTLVGIFARHNNYPAAFAVVAALQPLGVSALWLWLRRPSRSTADGIV
ncbi:MAG: MFS transporter [Bryobacteraceae bacterium]